MSLTLASEQSPSYWKAVVCSLVVLAAAATAVFYFNPHHTADLSVTHVEVFAPLTAFRAPHGSIHVIGQVPHVEQDLFVVLTIHLQNDLRLPLFVDEVDSQFTGGDGTLVDTVSPAMADLDRTQDIFPQLKPLTPRPLVLGDEVAPKSAVDGQVLLHFPNVSDAAWQTRKSAMLTVKFAHQDAISSPIPRGAATK